jgi:hypothetical protein
MVKPRRFETSERVRGLLSRFFKDLLSRLEPQTGTKGSEAFCVLLAINYFKRILPELIYSSVVSQLSL